ncbi:MAG TPA: hypothetical protein VK831_03275 [Candidatus Deferrimicrobiaceae bacterium]|nr:hypothetical protein [Candidatus Deferrimicrobiaceae bacterium]
MRKTLISIATALSLVALSATAALADPPVPAKGHGEAVSEVAKAVNYVSGQARGEAVSELAKQHGALVSAAAKAHGEAAAAAGKAKGEAAAESGSANGATASEPGRLKAEAGAGNAGG